jgi:hypothetical protein
MIDNLRKRLRPGSKAEAVSKVATSGQIVANEAASVRSHLPTEADPLAEHWPVAMMTAERKSKGNSSAEAIPFHAPDDPGVLRRLFRLDVPDI